jgi:hypothetical protein
LLNYKNFSKKTFPSTQTGIWAACVGYMKEATAPKCDASWDIFLLHINPIGTVHQYKAMHDINTSKGY